MSAQNNFAELRKIDVSQHIEKKNGLSYLSWAWAVDQLLQRDPSATWAYSEPMRFGETVMVFCTVNAFGKSMTAQLPVMDYRNKAIANPDAFAVNTAMQRALAKAIALHGIGLYIYAGEDIPSDENNTSTDVNNESLTEQQAADLEALAADVGADVALMCKYFKVGKVEEIPARRYAEVVKMLEAKRGK